MELTPQQELDLKERAARKKRLIHPLDNLTARITKGNKKAKWHGAPKVRQMDQKEITIKTVSFIINNIEKSQTLSSLACRLGISILAKVEDPNMTVAKRERRRFNAGFVALNAARLAGVLDISKDDSKRSAWMVHPKNHKDLLIYYFYASRAIDREYASNAVFEKPEPYTRFWNPISGDLIHKAHPEAIKYHTPNNVPLLYRMVNRQQDIAYAVNNPILDIVEACKGDDLLTRESKNLNKMQRRSILRGDEDTIKEAKRIGSREFYLYSYLDTRIRFYYCSHTLSPQGTELQKALIKFYKGIALGPTGMKSLMIHAANCFGEDKLSLEDRYKFALKQTLDEGSC